MHAALQVYNGCFVVSVSTPWMMLGAMQCSACLVFRHVADRFAAIDAIIS